MLESFFFCVSMWMCNVRMNAMVPGARLSKVPKLLGRITGGIILFVSSKWRRLLNFFFPLQHMNDQLYLISRLEFYKWLFGPKKVFGSSPQMEPARFAVRLWELQIFPIVRIGLFVGFRHQNEIDSWFDATLVLNSKCKALGRALIHTPTIEDSWYSESMSQTITEPKSSSSKWSSQAYWDTLWRLNGEA